MNESLTHIKIEKQLVPALRFKEFEDNWGKEKLMKHVNSISSGKIKPHEEGKYLVYGSTGVIGRSDEFTHDGDYLLIARVGANAGKINRVKGKYAVTDNTLIIDLKENNDVAFCESFLIKFNLNRLIFGSGQPLITGGLLKSLDFIFPDYPEQQKIASFLSAVDEKIQQLTKKKALLEQYKNGVMQQLFSGQLRFKDENGNPYPDWEESSVFDIADKKVKWSFTGGPFGSDLKSDDYTDSGIRVIQLQNIGDGVFHDKSKIYTSVEKADQLLACNIYAGEIILSKMGDPVARACVIPDSNNRWLMCSDGIRYVIDETRFSKSYLFDYINSSFFRKKALSLSTGSTRKRIGLGDLKEINISHPWIEEQEKIGMLLNSLGKKIERVNNQIIESQTFKKGLLQQMFVTA